MIHFKVIRASRLLLAAAIILLIVVLALIGFRLFAQNKAPAVTGSANLVDAGAIDEAKTETVFASSGDGGKLSLDPEGAVIEVEIVESPSDAKAVQHILIYHTHTHEAYEQVEDDPYDALEAWRTTDAVHSVVKVGEELAENLRRLGFDVVHDTTDHEGDQLSTAYTRSLATLQGYEQRFDLYIDLHRDAYEPGDPIAVKSEDGREMAPLMVLIGNGNGFDEKPWYAQNLAFAQVLERRINEIEPGLCKPVMVKDGRYNQHIGVFAILVEVGHNRNTLPQALNAVPPLSEAIKSVLIDDPDPKLSRMKAAWEKGHAHI